jgi:hypothetical protein
MIQDMLKEFLQYDNLKRMPEDKYYNLLKQKIN